MLFIPKSVNILSILCPKGDGVLLFMACLVILESWRYADCSCVMIGLRIDLVM